MDDLNAATSSSDQDKVETGVLKHKLGCCVLDAELAFFDARPNDSSL